MVRIAAFLPLPQESLGSFFLLTLVTPNCAGRIPLERGPWRVLEMLGKELRIQQHPLPQTWDREEAIRAHWEMGLGGQQSCSISISGGSRMTFGSEHQREAALAAGCLAEFILVALLDQLLISCPLPTLLGC